MTEHKVISIIPARAGSKRLPQKNILPLADKSLIAHSIGYAKANSSIIDEVYVSTDSELIKSIALEHAVKVIDRPRYLAEDSTPTSKVLQHAVEVLNLEKGYIILLQPTNPLRPKHLLQETMALIQSQPYDSLFTVTQNHKKLGKIISGKYIPFNYKPGQRSQDLAPLYFENGLIYITSIAQIKKGIIFDDSSYPFVVDHKFAQIDIDTKEDLDYAEYILKTHHG